jgi:hypothetical protein
LFGPTHRKLIVDKSIGIICFVANTILGSVETMTRTQGAADRVQRKRRCETDEQKEAKAAKKRQQEQQKSKTSKRAFVAALLPNPPSTTTTTMTTATTTTATAIAPTMENETPSQAALTPTPATPAAGDQAPMPPPAEDGAQEVNYDDFECDNLADLGNIVATMDDDTWNESSDQKSVMATYLRAVIVRIRALCTYKMSS